MILNIFKLSESFVLKNLEAIKDGSLELNNHDGKKYLFGQKNSDLKANIKVLDKKFYFNLIKGGSSALAESYVNDAFQTNDLTKLIELSARNIDITDKFNGMLNRFNFLHFIKRLFTSNNRTKSVEYISKHYDLGNDFFSIWLDKTLTYSCAIYNQPNEKLENAQINKYNKLIELIKPKSGNKILEIGCGWGGFSQFLAENYDCDITAITISKEQFSYTTDRIKKAKLNKKVNVVYCDYRNIQGKFDKILSIEMFEAVGKDYWNTFFKKIQSILKPNGIVGLQLITIDDKIYNVYKKNPDFIQKYIFPGGMLPSQKILKELITKNSLKLESVDSYANDYAKTLNIWNQKFNKNWKDIQKLGFDNKFKLMWNYYLSYCEGGFLSKNIDLKQIKIKFN